MEPLEQTTVPWVELVGRSSRAKSSGGAARQQQGFVVLQELQNGVDPESGNDLVNSAFGCENTAEARLWRPDRLGGEIPDSATAVTVGSVWQLIGHGEVLPWLMQTRIAGRA